MFDENALKIKTKKVLKKKRRNHPNLLKNKNHTKKKVLKKFASS